MRKQIFYSRPDAKFRCAEFWPDLRGQGGSAAGRERPLCLKGKPGCFPCNRFSFGKVLQRFPLSKPLRVFDSPFSTRKFAHRKFSIVPNGGTCPPFSENRLEVCAKIWVRVKFFWCLPTTCCFATHIERGKASHIDIKLIAGTNT